MGDLIARLHRDNGASLPDSVFSLSGWAPLVVSRHPGAAVSTQPFIRRLDGGDAVLVGRRIMERVTPLVQVARAIAVLDLCRAHWWPVGNQDLQCQLESAGRGPRSRHVRFLGRRTSAAAR
jgi:hypothetical protein